MRRTASSLVASAPSPYTVSVGNATKPPALMTSAARRMEAGSGWTGSTGRCRVGRIEILSSLASLWRNHQGAPRFYMPMRSLLLAGLLFSIPGSAETRLGLIAYDQCAEDGKVTEAEHAKCAQGKQRDDYVLVFVDQGNPEEDLRVVLRRARRPLRPASGSRSRAWSTRTSSRSTTSRPRPSRRGRSSRPQPAVMGRCGSLPGT